MLASEFARSFLTFPRLFGASVPSVAHLIPARLGDVGQSCLWFGGDYLSFLDGLASDLGAIRFAPRSDSGSTGDE